MKPVEFVVRDTYSLKAFYRLVGDKTAYKYNLFLTQCVGNSISSHIQGVVLDVGCGRQNYLLNLVGINPIFYISTDLSLDSLKENKLTQFKVVSDAEHLPFNEETIDCVIMLDVAEHLRNPGRVLKEVERCLKIEGN